MAEWIVDTRGGVCHQCDTAYQRLAGHWARDQSCTSGDFEDLVTLTVCLERNDR